MSLCLDCKVLKILKLEFKSQSLVIDLAVRKESGRNLGCFLIIPLLTTCGCLSRNLKIDLPSVSGEPVPMLYEVSCVLEMLQQLLEGCKIL